MAFKKRQSRLSILTLPEAIMTAHWNASSTVPLDMTDGNTNLLDMAILAHYEELCGTVRRRGHAPLAAQEIVHELYVRLRQRHTILEGKKSLRAFLIRACVNLGIDVHRRQRLEMQLFSGTETEALQISAPVYSPEQALDLEYRLARLKIAIMEMSVQRRRVFVASRVGQLSSDQIAARMKISKNMVDRHLRKAYLHCLDRLDETL